MSETAITQDEWLAELGRAMQSQDADGLTMNEIRQFLGLGERATAKRIHAAFAKRRLVCSGTRHVTKIDGTPGQIPVYNWVKDNEEV